MLKYSAFIHSALLGTLIDVPEVVPMDFSVPSASMSDADTVRPKGLLIVSVKGSPMLNAGAVEQYGYLYVEVVSGFDSAVSWESLLLNLVFIV